MRLSQKQKTFSAFFSPFFKSRLKFQHIQKRKMAITANVFPKLLTSKTWLDKYKKSSAL